MKNRNFETGAKSYQVNDLLLFIQTTRKLNEERLKIFEDWFKYGSFGVPPSKWTFDSFCNRSIIQYNKELPEKINLSKDEKIDFILICSSDYMDWKEENYDLRSVRVTYSNGEVINTNMAHGLKDEDIYNYFAIGKQFNISSGIEDNLQTVVKCEILK
jgi:hypothetical protein